MAGFRFLPVGDCALSVEFANEISEETNAKVRALALALKRENINGVLEWVPTYRALLIYYDPCVITCRRLVFTLRLIVRAVITRGLYTESGKRTWEIPVCYGGVYGEDLPFVAAHAGITPEEAVRIHSAFAYRIYMLGFLPGFTYLGGLHSRIHTPRLTTPRTRIPAGSVGIGGEQTGIYPIASPGGWQLIGRTPLRPYDPRRETPILFEAGDYLKFLPVDEARYLEIEKQVEAGTYKYRLAQEGLL